MLGRFAVGLGIAALTPAKPARRAPVKSGSVGITAIVVAVAIMVAGNVTHTWTVMWFVVIPLVLSVFIAAGNVQHYSRKRREVYRAIAQMPDGKPAVTTVAAMRERAGQLTRERRVASLLVPVCPVCGALAGVACTGVAGMTFFQLDKSRALNAHSLRIQKAVATGAADASEVAAQFGGSVPSELRRVLT